MLSVIFQCSREGLRVTKEKQHNGIRNVIMRIIKEEIWNYSDIQHA
jgi:hypothetical protein